MQHDVLELGCELRDTVMTLCFSWTTSYPAPFLSRLSMTAPPFLLIITYMWTLTDELAVVTQSSLLYDSSDLTQLTDDVRYHDVVA